MCAYHVGVTEVFRFTNHFNDESFFVVFEQVPVYNNSVAVLLSGSGIKRLSRLDAFSLLKTTNQQTNQLTNKLQWDFFICACG